MKNSITIIVAYTNNLLIGKDNSIPWHISDDLKRFKKLTTGNVIIMGRKTFESLGSKPLPNRTNIVISSKYRGKGCGKQLIDFLVNIGQEEGCYKIILDCKPELEKFYKKSGFSYKNIQMSKYFD